MQQLFLDILKSIVVLYCRDQHKLPPTNVDFKAYISSKYIHNYSKVQEIMLEINTW